MAFSMPGGRDIKHWILKFVSTQILD